MKARMLIFLLLSILVGSCDRAVGLRLQPRQVIDLSVDFLTRTLHAD